MRKRTLRCPYPHCPHERLLRFSDWIRENLPDSSTGFCVTNQDWIFFNFKLKKLMLLEQKTKMADISHWFKEFILNILHPALSEFCQKRGIDYWGYHLLQFENCGPEDGKIFFDYKEITVDELIDFLTFNPSREESAKSRGVFCKKSSDKEGE